jgi:hypothetical protein
MLDWSTLVRRSNFSSLDLVEVDAACSAGLPSIPNRDIAIDKKRVDDMGRSCARFIDRAMPMFRAGRCDYPESEAKFRIQAMITHLQRDLRVRYNPACKPDEAVFRPADSFLYGILHGKGGTCGSLPILYAAVGRRLTYPIKLVTTRSHMFCRWESPTERFNIEASGEGISFFPDEHFRSGRFAMPMPTILMCGYLQSLTPKEEVAGFMVQRAECWMQEKNYGEASAAFAWGAELDPRREQHMFLTGQAMTRWHEAIRPRVPPHFPKLDIIQPERLFREVPLKAELAFIRLRVSEELLNNPELEHRWWAPLRRDPGARPHDLPPSLRIDYCWDQPTRIAA